MKDYIEEFRKKDYREQDGRLFVEVDAHWLTKALTDTKNETLREVLEIIEEVGGMTEHEKVANVIDPALDLTRRKLKDDLKDHIKKELV